jgi:hypothetical protein
MPFKDPIRTREAKRLSAARRRAAARAESVVDPVVDPVPPVEPVPPTWSELELAGRILLAGPLNRGESLDAYRERLRRHWRTLMRVVEPSRARR